MYMCTYICGAGKASVRTLCLRPHFHVETCTDEFPLELASSLVHRPNCCISLGPQPQLECRFSPPWSRVFSTVGALLWFGHLGAAGQCSLECWRTTKPVIFSTLEDWEEQNCLETGKKSFTPSKVLMSSSSPVPYWGVTHCTHATAPTQSSDIFFGSCVAPFCYSNKEPALARGCDLQYTNPLKKHKWNTQLGRSSLMRWSVVRSGSSQHPPCRPEVIPSEQLLIIIIIWHFSSTSGAIFFSQESRLIVYQLIYIKKGLIEGLIK